MASQEEKLAAARRRMVETQIRARGIRRDDILAAFAEVPRERFIPEQYAHEAYEDHPVPIGLGQTISQPYIVALMVQELDPRPDHRILDVGSGSGYQTAILSRLCRHVYAVERVNELTARAISTLAALGVDNVTVCTRDGTVGWPEEAPFDGIICGAAAPDVPPSWADQLADGGRIVLPVGGEFSQTLLVVEKRGGKVRRREVCGVRFVKLIGREGWAEAPQR